MSIATTPQLRPLGIGQLLDQAIRLYRRNFFTFIGIIALVQIPLTVLQLVSSLLTTSGMLDIESASSFSDIFGLAYIAGMSGTLLVGLLSFILVHVVATAAMTRAVAGSYLGEKPEILGAYRKIGPAWPVLLATLILAIVVMIGLLIWFLVPCVGWLTGLGMLTFFGLVIIPLLAPVIILEKQKPGRAIRRAWDLARRRFWWVLAFVFILYLFGQLIITGPSMLIGAIFVSIIGEHTESSGSMPGFYMVAQAVLQALIPMLSSLIYLPLQLTAITLMYFDLRIRTEGFDLAIWQRCSLGAELPETPGRTGDKLLRRGVQ